METTVLKLDRNTYTDEDLKEAAGVIRRGGLVAFPTETVYGLGANALDPEGAAKIYEAKGRPSDNPLIVHISDMRGLSEIAENVDERAEKLAAAFWPGPLTMVLKKKGIVPDRTTGGLDTVAVRMPVDRIANDLIRISGLPIAAPSANTSGRPSPTKAAHVIEDMDGKIDYIIDGGDVEIGLESTIVDLTGDIPMLLRPGAITLEMLRDVLGEVETDPAIIGPPDKNLRPKAPGMKYRHYAPKADMTIFMGAASKVQERISREAGEYINEGKKVGIIATDESKNRYSAGIVRSIGTRTDEATVAHNLFAILRSFDDEGADIILSEGFEDDGIGRAIMNRMKKAAGYRIVEV